MIAQFDSPALLSHLPEGLGELRESLSALRNLHQLLGAIHAGPKLLGGILPEVQHCGVRMGEISGWLLEFAAKHFGESEESRAIRLYATDRIDSLNELLTDATRWPLLARRRLQLEGAMKGLLPDLLALVEHIELLLDAAQGICVTLHLAELLSSRPSHGSSRPLRTLSVRGPAGEVAVHLPPRVGLGLVSLLSQAPSLGSSPTLIIAPQEDDRVRLTFCRSSTLALPTGKTLQCSIPASHIIPPSAAVCRLVLRSFGAEFLADEPTTFTLPAAALTEDELDGDSSQ